MKLSEQLKQDHECGDFGKALEGYAERAALLEGAGAAMAKAGCMQQTMWAELKVDCHTGPECNEHKKYWYGYADGDKEGGQLKQALEFDAANFPPGTQIRVSVPVCPQCSATSELCECGFDWRQWVENKYA